MVEIFTIFDVEISNSKTNYNKSLEKKIGSRNFLYHNLIMIIKKHRKFQKSIVNDDENDINTPE